MGARSISLSEDAYERLESFKKEGEIFSEAVLRLTGRDNLERFQGSISEDFARDLREASRDTRERFGP